MIVSKDFSFYIPLGVEQVLDSVLIYFKISQISIPQFLNFQLVSFHGFPSNDDDVITSPYNSMLALNVLIDSADCIMPVDNQALFEIVNKVDA